MTGYDWDTRCADLELARLQAGFTGYDHANFSRVLLDGALHVEAAIHVETGRLKSSTDARIGTSSADRWEGTISVGGPGIRYAASEFFGYSPKHGGYPSHSFMRPVGWQPTPRGGVGHGEGGVPWSQQPVGNVA